MTTDTDTLDFGFQASPHHIIKVIGVGGGGGNAVNHMYIQGIKGVSFAICNTDCQPLKDSPVPVRLQLGTEGLGAGGNPEKGCAEAQKSKEEIYNLLNDGTKMVFITAGMGGGTGTGASPVIAQVARELGILTVGIVTIPFKFEGKKKIDRALDGVEALAGQVDSLLVINNERMREVYLDKSVLQAFDHADDTLTVAAQSIVELIHKTGILNIDFRDVNTVLRNGGVAIISTGYGEGEHRVAKAIQDAITSPLLNDNDIYNSEKILINLFFSDENGHTLGMDEMSDISDFMDKFNKDYENKPGLTVDRSLGDKVKVTILASGFGLSNNSYKERERGRQEVLTAEEERRENRRNKYYGNDPKKNQKKRKHQCFLFNNEALDDEEIIHDATDVPTYLRSRGQLQYMNEKQDELSHATTAAPQNISFRT